jgi:uncharacterized membrane protein
MKMTYSIMDRFRYIANRLRERLWVKPLAMCLASIAGVFVAKAIDSTGLRHIVPEISLESIESLLSIMASSMLVIATFAVTSMVSAYSSASTTATPRALRLIIADDMSQNALSTFVGAFIFSIVSLTAAKNDFFETAGRFSLFVLTLATLAVVIITFVRWIDRIARLGRQGETIEKVEEATNKALIRRRNSPTLRGVPVRKQVDDERPVYAPVVGYVRHVDVTALQNIATQAGIRVVVAALPGAFVAPGRPLAFVLSEDAEFDERMITDAFIIGAERIFDDDPRFGLVVLSEIAGRALSPAVNDPGTAIQVIGTLVRLFSDYAKPIEAEVSTVADCDRVEVPEILVQDMFDDAFTAITRDGAGTFEVMARLQKAFDSLASLGDEAIREAAIHHSRMALTRSEKALVLPDEVAVIRELARLISIETRVYSAQHLYGLRLSRKNFTSGSES